MLWRCIKVDQSGRVRRCISHLELTTRLTLSHSLNHPISQLHIRAAQIDLHPIRTKMEFPQTSIRNEMRILKWGHAAQITLVLAVIIIAFIKIGTGNVPGRSDVWGLSVVSHPLNQADQTKPSRLTLR